MPFVLISISTTPDDNSPFRLSSVITNLASGAGIPSPLCLQPSILWYIYIYIHTSNQTDATIQSPSDLTAESQLQLLHVATLYPVNQMRSFPSASDESEIALAPSDTHRLHLDLATIIQDRRRWVLRLPHDRELQNQDGEQRRLKFVMWSF